MAKEQWGAGDPSKWSDWGKVRIGKTDYPLIWGEHKHSYSENKMYVLIGDKPVEFDGHRILVDVQLKSKNYLKESEVSGDEYRKGGSGEILADGEIVYEFFFRDINWALHKADNLIGKLLEHSSGWMKKEDREKLVGKQIYYERTPAIITSLIIDQGCIMLKPDEGLTFSAPVYCDAEEAEDWVSEYGDQMKVEVLDPSIWWFRND